MCAHACVSSQSSICVDFIETETYKHNKVWHAKHNTGTLEFRKKKNFYFAKRRCDEQSGHVPVKIFNIFEHPIFSAAFCRVACRVAM